MPIGNGRLGVAIYGSASEVLEINENSIWSGPLQNRTPPDALEAEPIARQMLLDGEIPPGSEYVMQEMISNITAPRSYSYFGNVNIDFGHLDTELTNHTRWLATKEGTSGLTYMYGDAKFTLVYKPQLPENHGLTMTTDVNTWQAIPTESSPRGSSPMYLEH
jgi:hypothetical protein